MKTNATKNRKAGGRQSICPASDSRDHPSSRTYEAAKQLSIAAARTSDPATVVELRALVKQTLTLSDELAGAESCD